LPPEPEDPDRRLNLVGDGVRDLFDPRHNQRQS
jgi:hypothetical protein